MKKLLLVTASLLLCLPAISQAQETTTDVPISTERPSVGAGPDLVPVHRVIIENGASFSTGQGTVVADLPESMVRVGVTNSVELRSNLPNMEHSGDFSGLRDQDAAISAKLRVHSSEKWPVSSVIGVSMPSGSKNLTSGEWDPSLMLSTSHNWSSKIGSFASGNMTWATVGSSGRKPVTQFAVDGLWSTTPAVTTYVEWAPLYVPVAHNSGYTVDTGAMWILHKYVQLDFRVGRSVVDTQARTVVGAGCSFSFLRRPL
jgi:hypothetical protein